MPDLDSRDALPVVLDSRSPAPVTLTPAEGYPVPPAPLVVRCYVRAEDMAACVPTPPADAAMDELLAAAAREVDAAIAARYASTAPLLGYPARR